MKPRSRFWPTVKRTLLRLIWHGFPFVILALVVVFVIIPMGRKISAEKAELAEQQSRQVQETAEATRVITLEMVPEDLMERISLPGMARPWKSLEVVAEVAGRIMEKKWMTVPWSTRGMCWRSLISGITRMPMIRPGRL